MTDGASVWWRKWRFKSPSGHGLVPIEASHLRALQMLRNGSLPQDYEDFLRCVGASAPSPDAEVRDVQGGMHDVFLLYGYPWTASGYDRFETVIKRDSRRLVNGGLIEAGTLVVGCDIEDNYYALEPSGRITWIQHDAEATGDPRYPSVQIATSFAEFVDSFERDELLRP